MEIRSVQYGRGVEISLDWSEVETVGTASTQALITMHQTDAEALCRELMKFVGIEEKVEE